MTTSRPTSAPARATLWVAVLLLLVTALAHLRLSRCIGDCGTGTDEAAASCCAVVTVDLTDGATCCGCCGCCDCCDCCDCATPAAAAKRGRLDVAVDDGQDAPQGSVRGTCAPGCRLTITFEGVEFAPAPAGTQLADGTPAAFVPLATNWPTPDRRPLTRGRPFDRGPPRVDAGTALRACTVLLI